MELVEKLLRYVGSLVVLAQNLASTAATRTCDWSRDIPPLPKTTKMNMIYVS